MRVAVIGCGYVGLVTGVGLASVGHSVVGVEIDAGRREKIGGGTAPFFEPGLDELLRGELATGRFRLESELAAAADADVVFLAVQTPPDPEGAIDLRFLREAAEGLARVLVPGKRRVVAVRSTVVPGTTAGLVAPILGGVAAIASNPEFLSEGSVVADFLEPDRIVVGCDDSVGRKLLVELYRPLGRPVCLTSPTAAELAKYTSNALLATLISFSNEIARISESLPGVDVDDVLSIVHRDRRWSPTVDGRVVSPGILSYLRAGCGYGGSCLPKDLSALLAARNAAGFEHPLLDGVRKVNETQPSRLVDQARAALRGLDGRRIALLGVAFKGGTDDVRASPGLAILDELVAAGARVTVHDPLVRREAIEDRLAGGAVWATELGEALEAAEAVVVTTNAPEYRSLPAELSRSNGSVPFVVDGRRTIDPEDVDEGRYVGIGRAPAA